MVHERAKSVDITGKIRLPIRTMKLDEVDTTGTSKEGALHPTDLPGGKEVADRQSGSPPGQQTRTGSQKKSDGDSANAELSLLPLHLHEDQAEREIDLSTSSPIHNLRRSASYPLLASPTHPLPPNSLSELKTWKFSIHLKLLNRQTRSPHFSNLVSVHLSAHPPDFLLHHDSPRTGPTTIPLDTPFGMFHFPPNPAFVAGYQQYMAEYHSRALHDLLDASECPIGNESELRDRPYNAVVLIENVPYTITRQEVIQFFGRDGNLAAGWPVHIIMERSTGKTMACYVEFDHPVDAQRAVDRIKKKHDANQGPRMGNRYVDVVLSSQEALMKALFPRANRIEWINGRPVQVAPPPDEKYPPPEFVGFLTDEELFCVARHAREPNRSAYATKVPQRTYESVISTVWKFPWFATHMYTVYARNKLFSTLKSMVEVLVERLAKEQTLGLDGRLVSDLLRAGFECPAFNPRMKYVLAEASEDQGILRRMHPDWLPLFPFDTLTWLPPHNPIKLEFYARLIAQGHPDKVPEGLKRLCFTPDVPKLYGDWWFEWLSEPASKKLFSAAATEERQLLRSLLTSGFAAMNGTAPGPSNPPPAPPHAPPSAGPSAGPAPAPGAGSRRTPGPRGTRPSRGPYSPGNWRGGSSTGGGRRRPQ